MRLDVLGQSLGTLETPGTEVTLVREAGVVAGHVQLHLPVVPEAFPAELAVEGRLAGVGPHVDLEPVLVNIAPLTELTHQRIVNLVSLFVDDQLVLRGTDLGEPYLFVL